MSALLDGESIDSIDESLLEISSLVAEAINARHCKILLLSEKRVAQIGLHSGAEFGDLPDFECEKSHGRKHARSEIGGVAIQSAPASAESGALQDRMFAAMVLHGKIIGAVCAREPQQKQYFSAADLSLLRTLTVLVSKAVQVNRVQQILDSPFAQMSLSKSSHKTVYEIVSNCAHNPNIIARVLAKSFYREMTRAGFSFNQIIHAASEIISELSTNVRKHHGGHKRRLANDDIRDDGASNPQHDFRSSFDNGRMSDISAGSADR